jgi:hypothetical protein
MFSFFLSFAAIAKREELEFDAEAQKKKLKEKWCEKNDYATMR